MGDDVPESDDFLPRGFRVMGEELALGVVIYFLDGFSNALETHTGRVEQYHCVHRSEEIMVCLDVSGCVQNKLALMNNELQQIVASVFR